MRPISAKRLRKQRGNVMVEFALVAPFLMAMLTGSFTMGMSLTKAVQASQLCRNANVLMVRAIDMSKTENKQILLRTGSGLGLNVAGTNTPDPNGKGVIILTKVVKVGDNACNLGITAWNGNPTSCANHGLYVIGQRILIGNTSRWTSLTGTPSITSAADGSFTDNQIATSTGIRANGFPGIVELENDDFVYVSEVFCDVSEISIFKWITAPIINVRNVS